MTLFRRHLKLKMPRVLMFVVAVHLPRSLSQSRPPSSSINFNTRWNAYHTRCAERRDSVLYHHSVNIDSDMQLQLGLSALTATTSLTPDQVLTDDLGSA